MNKVKINIFFPIFIAIIFLFTFSQNILAADATLDVKFNKIIYSPTDSMDININLLPKKDLSDVRVSLKIGKKDDYVFSKTNYLGNIKSKEKQIIIFSKINAKSFGFKIGINPVLIEVTSKQKIINKYDALIGIKDYHEHEKLNVALAVKIVPRPYMDVEKNIISSELNNKVFTALDKYQQIAQKHNGFFNFIFSPMLAEEIKKMSNGYVLSENSKTTAVSNQSPSSKKAAATLNSYKKLFETKKAYLVLTSYSNINAKQFNSASFRDQFSHGKTILDNVFSNVYPAIYSNGSKIYSSQNYGKNKLWLSNSALKDTRHIKTIESLPNIVNKQASLMTTFASLIDAQNDGKNSIVLITDSMVQANYISNFIALAKKQSWLSLKPLSSLKTKAAKRKLKKPSKQNKALSEIRKKYYLLKNALASESEEFNTSQMAIYLAEDNYYKNDSTEFINIANQKLSSELAKIHLQLTPIALTGGSGKLPIKIINNTNSKLKLFIRLKANKLEIKNSKKAILINPKENLISVPVKVLESGNINVKVDLLSKNNIITSGNLVVSTSLPGDFWFYAGLFIFIFFLLIIGAFYVRDKKSKASTNK